MQSNIAEPPANTPELSVVMPCLNEADTIETCIRKALQIFQEHQLSAEVVIGDNGSTDGSVEIAEGLGARVVHVAEPGYGNALMGGIAAARGTYVIMGDADDSYDFLEIPKFVEKLREGYDLVQGCRLPWGGGTVLPGAMPPARLESRSMSSMRPLPFSMRARIWCSHCVPSRHWLHWPQLSCS